MNPNLQQHTDEEITEMLRGTSERERFLHRLHAVKLVLHGHSCSEVAKIYGDSPRSVAYWVKQFHENGTDGLREEERSGRPSKLNESQIKKLIAFIRKNEEHVTGAMLSEHILKTFRVKLTARQCWRLLKTLPLET